MDNMEDMILAAMARASGPKAKPRSLGEFNELIRMHGRGKAKPLACDNADDRQHIRELRGISEFFVGRSDMISDALKMWLSNELVRRMPDAEAHKCSIHGSFNHGTILVEHTRERMERNEDLLAFKASMLFKQIGLELVVDSDHMLQVLREIHAHALEHGTEAVGKIDTYRLSERLVDIPADRPWKIFSVATSPCSSSGRDQLGFLLYDPQSIGDSIEDSGWEPIDEHLRQFRRRRATIEELGGWAEHTSTDQHDACRALLVAEVNTALEQALLTPLMGYAIAKQRGLDVGSERFYPLVTTHWLALDRHNNSEPYGCDGSSVQPGTQMFPISPETIFSVVAEVWRKPVYGSGENFALQQKLIDKTLPASLRLAEAMYTLVWHHGCPYVAYYAL
jgi:hypothetical protein